MHSRRAYYALRSKEEADLHSLLWAVESMRDLRQHQVSFESSSIEMRDILLNPQNFHHFHHLVSAITYNLQAIEGWSVHHANLECNSAAGAIATSVTTGRRYQSCDAKMVMGSLRGKKMMFVSDSLKPKNVTFHIWASIEVAMHNVPARILLNQFYVGLQCND
ncbi:hypothetical protein F2Q69_00040136 [Brassica cretica]|uniref:RNase H type-1 domain-containing protein n=1 Tax=Brassica cretica TaxID=69181 RepID=A0A8S9NP32_BRACR|nr:hypothetical protein F2Q69_00040136 [Brassica cretica]